jgi:hypothetical protein
MFRAALTSLSCSVPQSAHIHSLIPSPALPFGLLAERLPQHEQAWVVYASLTSANTTDRVIALYFSWVFSMNRPASKTLFATVVLAKKANMGCAAGGYNGNFHHHIEIPTTPYIL